MINALRRSLFLVILFFGLSAIQMQAQFAIGVTAEQRETSLIGEPEFGVGVRIENDFKIRAPRIRFAWRLHASAFSTKRNYQDTFNEIIQDPINAQIIDGGLGLLLDVKMPLFLNAYGGVGAGFERQNFSVVSSAIEGQNPVTQEWDDFAWTYDGFIGLKFSSIPIFKPFIEYRYTEYLQQNEVLPSNGRLLFGLMLAF